MAECIGTVKGPGETPYEFTFITLEIVEQLQQLFGNNSNQSGSYKRHFMNLCELDN